MRERMRESMRERDSVVMSQLTITNHINLDKSITRAQKMYADYCF